MIGEMAAVTCNMCAIDSYPEFVGSDITKWIHPPRPSNNFPGGECTAAIIWEVEARAEAALEESQ